MNFNLFSIRTTLYVKNIETREECKEIVILIIFLTV